MSACWRRVAAQVAVGVVGDEARAAVERERRRVVGAHLEVRRGGAALGGPAQQRVARPPGRAAPRRRSGATQTSVSPTQSSPSGRRPGPARRRRRPTWIDRERSCSGPSSTARASVAVLRARVVGGQPPVGRGGRPMHDVAAAARRQQAGARRAAACATAGDWSSESASPGPGGDPARRPAKPPTARPSRPRPGPRPAGRGRRRTRAPRRAPSSHGTPGSPASSTELARALNPPDARSTQSPSGSASTAGHDPWARRAASSAGTRSGADGRGGTGLPDTMSARVDRHARRAVLAAPTVRRVVPGLQHPEHVGHRRAAARARLAGQHPAHDHARPDAGGTERGRRHGPLLGVRSTLRVPVRVHRTGY